MHLQDDEMFAAAAETTQQGKNVSWMMSCGFVLFILALKIMH
jgi:hypothetical protein